MLIWCECTHVASAMMAPYSISDMETAAVNPSSAVSPFFSLAAAGCGSVLFRGKKLGIKNFESTGEARFLSWNQAMFFLIAKISSIPTEPNVLNNKCFVGVTPVSTPLK